MLGWIATKSAGALIGVLMTSIVHGDNSVLSFPDDSEASWRISENGVVHHTPEALEIPVVVGKQQAIGSERAYILIQAPYQQVKTVVSEALKDRVTLVEEQLLLSTLEAPWRQVMLSRRPQQMTELADNEPTLAQAVSDGALMPEESDWRQRHAVANLQASSEALATLPELRNLYTRAESFRQWQEGWRNQYDIEQTVVVFDAMLLFGTESTIIDIHRRHSFPNPARKVILAADGVPTHLSQSLVPGEMFMAVISALDQALPGVERRISTDPTAWEAGHPLLPSMPEPDLRFEDDTQSELTPDIFTLTSDDALDPQTLQVMADGSLAIGVQRSARIDGTREWITEVWRLLPEQSSLTVLWQGWEGADPMLVNEEGNTLWFRGRPFGESDWQLYRYQTSQTVAEPWPVSLAAGTSSLGGILRGQLDGQGRPRFYSYNVGRFYRYRNEEHGQWHYHAVEVPRAALFSQPLRPVRWMGESLWVEDLYGLAELDAESGRVERVIQAPQRYGNFPHQGVPATPDLRDHPASWEPIGSARGQWATSGFQLRLESRGEQVAGMHVFDTDKGSYLYSAVLDGQDHIHTAAASPDGRWLAMAAADQLQLREVRTGRAPIALQVPAEAYIRALAFSADSHDLYALTFSTVLHWRLPSP
ncbi:hypothetical protein [Halomonas sp. SpR8]|uniref:hypothetical protein n=1 Tax=Halomonas sp. SpR8 TaxID=3050463 RepID=UPI0027E54E63|nr:hypothetical protein [Halomonas sp. SpR8]MDQ7728549.1 hypothetical protein [Halomonas sp. SpR8]